MIKYCQAGRVYNRAFSNFNFSGRVKQFGKQIKNLYIKLGYIIFAIDSFYLLAVDLDARQLCIQNTNKHIKAQMSVKKLSDVEFLNSVVNRGIFEFS